MSALVQMKESSLVEREVTELRVFITSWNMGNAEARGLEHIFAEKNVSEKFNMVVIGLQESTYATNSEGNPVDCIAQLSQQIASTLGNKFYQVQHCQRAQLQLFVFAKLHLKHHISQIEFSVENTGFLHVFPNKGGLLISLIVGGTKIAFISCHLTAHEGVTHCEQRNASIAEILEGVRTGDTRFDVTHQFHHVFWMGDMNYRLTFSDEVPSNTKKNIALLNSAVEGKKGSSGKPLSPAPNTTSTTSDSSSAVVVRSEEVELSLDDDIMEGFGDDDDSDDSDHETRPSDAEVAAGKQPQKLSKKAAKKEEHKHNRNRVLEMVKARKWKELLALDELNRELEAGRVLNSFTALQPSFWPTFKRSRDMLLPASPDASVLNSLSDYYNAKRIPSFTDRILYSSTGIYADGCVPLFFDACEQAISSDHKPVRAGFQIQVHNPAKDILVDSLLAHKRPSASRSASSTTASSLLSSSPLILRLKMFEMRGYNLEEMDSQLFGGGSDPYVVVTTQPSSLLLKKGQLIPHTTAHSGIKSSVITHNLNPVWKDELQIQLASMDVIGLSHHATILLSVWDEDQMNADDLIGVCTLPLRDILECLLIDQKPFFSFNEVLRSNSEIMGRIEGKLALNDVLADVLQETHLVTEVRNRSSNVDPAHLSRITPLEGVEDEVKLHDHSPACCSLA